MHVFILYKTIISILIVLLLAIDLWAIKMLIYAFATRNVCFAQNGNFRFSYVSACLEVTEFTTVDCAPIDRLALECYMIVSSEEPD